MTTHHEYRGYVFSITYQPQHPAYTVDFHDFPNIITSGDALADAFANACEALDIHLARKHGQTEDSRAQAKTPAGLRDGMNAPHGPREGSDMLTNYIRATR